MATSLLLTLYDLSVFLILVKRIPFFFLGRAGETYRKKQKGSVMQFSLYIFAPPLCQQ